MISVFNRLILIYHCTAAPEIAGTLAPSGEHLGFYKSVRDSSGRHATINHLVVVVGAEVASWQQRVVDAPVDYHVLQGFGVNASVGLIVYVLFATPPFVDAPTAADFQAMFGTLLDSCHVEPGNTCVSTGASGIVPTV